VEFKKIIVKAAEILDLSVQSLEEKKDPFNQRSFNRDP
jgi:hypothetical protein